MKINLRSILHHLYNRLPNKQESSIFVGYQAEGICGSFLSKIRIAESTVWKYLNYPKSMIWKGCPRIWIKTNC